MNSRMLRNASRLGGFTETEITAIQVCYSIFGSVGLIENIGIIMFILCKRIMLDFPSNWFVLSLAIADASHCVEGIFFAIIIKMSVLKYVKVYSIIVQFTLLSSTGNVFLLTFDRFLSVYNPLRYTAYMTTSRAKCLVWVPWINALLITAFVEFLTEEGITRMTNFVTAFYTVLISLITVLNIYMIRKARDKRKADVRQENAFTRPPGLKSSKRDQRLLIKIRLLIMNLAFFGSCLPMTTVLYLYPTTESRQQFSFQYKVTWCTLIIILNAAINPLVYSVNHPIFKKCFNKLRKMLLIDHSVAPIS